MSVQSEALKERTISFAVDISRLVDSLSPSPGAVVVGRQLAKSATSIGANYRAACNARSPAEFIAKLCIVNEEADESVYWLDIIVRTHYLPLEQMEPLRQEAIELRAIFGRSLGTARKNSHQMTK